MCNARKCRRCRRPNWRLGVTPCFEVLVDVPNYVGTFRGSGPSGFGDVVPAMKWQVSPVPGKFDISITAGAALPTGAAAIAGPGVQPHVQFAWSIELGAGWAIRGMETNFFTPSSQVVKYCNQSTLVIEKETTERSFLFVEYVGDYPVHGGTSHLFNSGGGYRPWLRGRCSPDCRRLIAPHEVGRVGQVRTFLGLSIQPIKPERVPEAENVSWRIAIEAEA
jgi:hypothetical protein